MSEESQVIEELFHEARKLPPPDREIFLNERCNGDFRVRARVTLLLEAWENSEGILDRGVMAMVNPERNTNLTGRTLAGHYFLISVLGTGGSATVYRAQYKKPNFTLDVAIKVPKDPSWLARRNNEAQCLARLKHPNIAAVHDLEEDGELRFLVMELVEGNSLCRKLEDGPMPRAEALHVARQIAEAAAYAHREDVIHRDLKPANIMVSLQGHVKVLDFGIARMLRRHTQTISANDSTETSNYALMGTVAYMAPEQFNGLADRRSDIWAMGCILYEMLTGELPFPAKTVGAARAKIERDEPSFAPMPASAAELGEVVRRCLNKNPVERYGSAEELLDALRAIELRITSPLPAPPEEAPPVPVPDPVSPNQIIPRPLARVLFTMIQLGYLALYMGICYHLDAIVRIMIKNDLPWVAGETALIDFALCGFAIRIFFLTHIGWDLPDTGKKFRSLFPALLPLDIVWALSPLLLAPVLDSRFAVSLICVALLVHLPFSQRTLIEYGIDPKRD